MSEIFDMMREGTLSPIWFYMSVYAIICASMNVTMAKTKGYRILPAVVLSLIPIVNIVSALIYLGLPKKD